MATHSNIFAWRIPWTEEPRGLPSIRSQRVRHNWSDIACMTIFFSSVQFRLSVMSNSVTLWTAAHQSSLSITNSWSLLKLMSIKSVMPSNYLILCHPLLLLPSIFPSIRAFSSESMEILKPVPNKYQMTINPPSFFELWMLACLRIQALIFLYLHQPLSWFPVDSSLITTFLHTAA